MWLIEWGSEPRINFYARTKEIADKYVKESAKDMGYIAIEIDNEDGYVNYEIFESDTFRYAYDVTIYKAEEVE